MFKRKENKQLFQNSNEPEANTVHEAVVYKHFEAIRNENITTE